MKFNINEWPRGFFCCLTALCSVACGDPARAHATIVAKDPLDIPPTITRTDPTTVSVDLTATELNADVGGGWIARAWTFGGTIPGPLIRVMEGDTVVIHLTNALGNSEPHSIDLHAVVGDGGGADETEILPGQTATLEFQAQHQGAFLYHCAAEGMPWEHLAHGMYGAILVEPRGGLTPVDVEAYVAESEWYLEPSDPEGVSDLDEAAARHSEPNFFTFNGHQEALSSPNLFGNSIRVPQAGRARIVFANAGPNLPASIHLVGNIFDDVYFGPFDAPTRGLQTASVPPGSAAVFEATFPAAGTYEIVDHALYHAEQGALGMLHAEPVP